MRSRPLHLCSLILLTLAAFGQTTIPRAPVPADPHELATGETIVASDAGQRASVLSRKSSRRQPSTYTRSWGVVIWAHPIVSFPHARSAFMNSFSASWEKIRSAVAVRN